LHTWKLGEKKTHKLSEQKKCGEEAAPKDNSTSFGFAKKRNRNKNKYKKELSGTKLIRKKFLRAFLGK